MWISPHVIFDLTAIDTGFQTDYLSFLTVHIVPNEDDTAKNRKPYYGSAPLQKHTQSLRLSFYFSF
jgi:hypothetical protein